LNDQRIALRLAVLAYFTRCAAAADAWATTVALIVRSAEVRVTSNLSARILRIENTRLVVNST
jgi:hypothetical protein